MGTAWPTTTRYIVGVGLVLLFLFVVNISRGVLPLLIIAALIAYIVSPIIRLLHHGLRLPRGVAVAITHLMVALLLILLPLLILPPIISLFNYLRDLEWPTLFENTRAGLTEFLTNLKANGLMIFGLQLDVSSIVDPLLEAVTGADPSFGDEPVNLGSISQSIGALFSSGIGLAVGVASTLFGGVISFIFIILSSLYISQDYQRLYRGVVGATPARYRGEITILLSRLRRVWDAFFRGQLLLALIIGVVVWIGLSALGVQGAFALGILAGLLEIVPTLGPILASIPSIIIALFQGSANLPVSNGTFAIIVIIFYVLVQQLENTLIVPNVLGTAVNLPPLAVMTGVLVGTGLGGILGALLAAPVIASGVEIVRYLYRKMLDQEPFPSEENAEMESSFTWEELTRMVASWRLRMTAGRTKDSGSRD